MLATNNKPLSSVVDYKKVVLTSVSDLQQLRDFSQTLPLTKSIELINDIFQRIEAKSVIGETAKLSNNTEWLTQGRFSELEKTLEPFLKIGRAHV